MFVQSCVVCTSFVKAGRKICIGKSVSGDSLFRISALGVDGRACVFLLSLWEGIFLHL